MLVIMTMSQAAKLIAELEKIEKEPLDPREPRIPVHVDIDFSQKVYPNNQQPEKER